MIKRIFGLLVPALVAGFLLPAGALAQNCTGQPSANTICAGPSSGGTGMPGFRQVIGGDIAGSTITGSNLASGTVANSNLSSMAAFTHKCNPTGSGAVPSDCSFPILNVKDYGATGNGTTDDTTAIQNAIAALPASGGIVEFPVGNYKVSQSIVIGNGSASAASTRQGVILQGVGSPNTQPAFDLTATAGPKLTWAGTTNNNVIGVNGPLQGWGVQNLYIDCASTAGVTGLFVTSGQLGDSRNITFNNCPTGLASSTVPLGSFGNADSIWNRYDHISILVPAINASKGILLTGNAACTSNTDFNTFINTDISLPPTGTVVGIYVQDADTDNFYSTHIFGNNASADSVTFDYTLCTAFPSAVMFNLIDPKLVAGTTFVQTGTPAAGAAPNYIFPLGEANAATCPNLANLTCYGSHNLVLSPGGNNPNTQLIASNGHFDLNGPTPSITAGCGGAGSTVTGSDQGALIGGQTAAATGCTVTFAHAFSVTPSCIAQSLSAGVAFSANPSYSTTSISVTFPSTVNFVWSFVCRGV